MKKWLYFIVVLSGLFFSFQNSALACSALEKRLGTCDSSTVIYCGSDEECGLEQGVNIVKNDIDGIVVDQKASEYIQEIVVYLLTFITLIAILYIIYAGFKVLTGAGDEEAQGEAKKIIVSVFLGILIMWLSFAIVNFMLDVLGSPGENIETGVMN